MQLVVVVQAVGNGALVARIDAALRAALTSSAASLSVRFCSAA
jgi:hypothetical protein